MNIQKISNYSKILNEIKNYIQNTKVLMYWNIGKILSDNDADSAIMQQLAKDLNVTKTNLYNALNFYTAYPQIPKTDLDWTKYAILSDVKEPELRQFLENKAITENLSFRELQKEIKKEKITETEIIQQKKLNANRGVLYNYKMVKPAPNLPFCLDIGFSTFKFVEFANDVEQKDGNIVQVEKINEEKYLAKKIDTTSKRICTFKSYLLKIVDGDTIRVLVDFGFKIYQEKIIRLRDVYAEEMDTEKGQKQKKVLENIFKNIEILIIRVNNVDKYGRFVSDVFYAENENNSQEIADSGIFLNQELVDLFNK